MSETLHCIFHCRQCSGTIALPHEAIGNMFSDQKYLRKIDAPAAILVCPYCKQVQACYYPKAIDVACPILDRVVLLSKSSDTILVGWLRCGTAGCTPPLPLFAQWNFATTEAEREADKATWVWDGLQCPGGHSVPKPENYDHP